MKPNIPARKPDSIHLSRAREYVLLRCAACLSPAVCRVRTLYGEKSSRATYLCREHTRAFLDSLNGVWP